MNQSNTKSEGTEMRLALRPREAAATLGISERLLWTLTHDGTIPHIRVHRAVRYPVAQLRDWLKGQADGAPAKQV